MIILSAADLTVTLRSPELGNSIRLPLGLKIHRAYDGELYTYKKSNVKAVHSLTFAKLSRDEVDQLFNFMRNTASQYITYVDFDGVTHNARMLTTLASFTHQSRNNRNISIELEVGDYATGTVG